LCLYVDELNLGLILGLSLGLGIPVLLFVVVGVIYYCQVSKSNQKVNPNNNTGTSNTTADAILDIPLAPTKTTY
jgi:CHASE3 domain sensor protein